LPLEPISIDHDGSLSLVYMSPVAASLQQTYALQEEEQDSRNVYDDGEENGEQKNVGGTCGVP